MLNFEDIPKNVEALINNNDWTEAHTEEILGRMRELLNARLSDTPRSNLKLTSSAIVDQCDRRQWFRFNEPPEKFHPKGAKSRLTFLLGDMSELLVLALVEAAGYKVEGRQDETVVEEVVGRRDALIDGMTVDVKTTGHRGFPFYKNGSLMQTDKFGTLVQLASYFVGGLRDERMTNRSEAGILAYNRDSGELSAVRYPMVDKAKACVQTIRRVKAMLVGPKPNALPLNDFACSSCHLKTKCRSAA